MPNTGRTLNINSYYNTIVHSTLLHHAEPSPQRQFPDSRAVQLGKRGSEDWVNTFKGERHSLKPSFDFDLSPIAGPLNLKGVPTAPSIFPKRQPSAPRDSVRPLPTRTRYA